MISLPLRAESEAALAEALPFARSTDETGAPCWIDYTHDYALDRIGPVVTTPGVYDEDGAEITPPVINPAYHANLRCTPEIAALVPAEIAIPAPAYPKRVWA